MTLSRPFFTSLLLGTSTLVTPALAQSGMNTSSLQQEVVLEGLENPWDMAFLDNGTMLFTEKCSGLSVLMPDGTVNALYGVGDSPTPYSAFTVLSGMSTDRPLHFSVNSIVPLSKNAISHGFSNPSITTSC